MSTEPAPAPEEGINIKEAPAAVVEKMLKMLTLAKNAATEGEAESAMAAARKMAIKHQIDLSTVRDDMLNTAKPSKEPFVEIPLKVAKGLCRRPPSDKYIRWVLASHFDVSILLGQGLRSSMIYIVGRKSAAKFAEYAYKFLHRAFTRIWRKYKHDGEAAGDFVPMTDRNSVFYGIYKGFDEALRQAANEAKEDAFSSIRATTKDGDPDEAMQKAIDGFQLVVVTEDKERNDFVNKNLHPVTVKGLGSGSIANWSAVRHGREEGGKLRVHMPIDSSAASNPKLQ
jgi:hypothetical protein